MLPKLDCAFLVRPVPLDAPTFLAKNSKFCETGALQLPLSDENNKVSGKFEQVESVKCFEDNYSECIPGASWSIAVVSLSYSD